VIERLIMTAIFPFVCIAALFVELTELLLDWVQFCINEAWGIWNDE
jgi:hypothetical protein